MPGCFREGTKWEVETSVAAQVQPGLSASERDIYDAVMVCNGHYSAPRTPDVLGMDSSPCVCEHSHNYRRPEEYAGKSVLIVGAHASGAEMPSACAFLQLVSAVCVFLCSVDHLPVQQTKQPWVFTRSKYLIRTVFALIFAAPVRVMRQIRCRHISSFDFVHDIHTTKPAATDTSHERMMQAIVV